MRRHGNAHEDLSDDPLEQGAHRAGSLVFVIENLTLEEARRTRKMWGLTFENTEGHRLQARDDEI